MQDAGGITQDVIASTKGCLRSLVWNGGVRAIARFVHVIDVDYRRRARIAHDLGTRDVHAEIYDSLEEFGQTKPASGFVFAADDETNWSPEEISQILQAIGTSMPFVVYSNEPTTDKVVSAMLCGALDYLE